MQNFKKPLALVLAVMMVFSMFSMVNISSFAETGARTVEEIDAEVNSITYFWGLDLDKYKALQAEYGDSTESAGYARITNAIAKLDGTGYNFYDDFKGYTEENPITDVYAINYYTEGKIVGTIEAATDADGVGYLKLNRSSNDSSTGHTQLVGLAPSFAADKPVLRMSGDFYNYYGTWDYNNTAFAPEAVSGASSYKIAGANRWVISGNNRYNASWYTTDTDT